MSAVNMAKESMTISWEGGVQLVAEVRNHRAVADQPVEEGGQDKGITPIEMFVASLGTCIGYYGVRFLQRHKISAAGFKIAVEWDYAEQPHRIGSIAVRVDLPGKLESATKERLQKVLEGCTVHNSIMVPPAISIQLTTISKTEADGDGEK